MVVFKKSTIGAFVLRVIKKIKHILNCQDKVLFKELLANTKQP